MGHWRTILILVAIMTAVALVTGGLAIGILYDAAFEARRAGLVQTAESQARLIEAMMRHQQAESSEVAARHTLEQIADAQERSGGLGETGEAEPVGVGYRLAAGDGVHAVVHYHMDQVLRSLPSDGHQRAQVHQQAAVAVHHEDFLVGPRQADAEGH